MGTGRRPCPPAPDPLEEYAARFDDLRCSLARRRGFRDYLAGLLLSRDRNKTLTCLAGAEPAVGAQNAAVRRLRFFLSESPWEYERVNARRLEVLRADPANAPHAGGVLVVDDTGDLCGPVGQECGQAGACLSEDARRTSKILKAQDHHIGSLHVTRGGSFGGSRVSGGGGFEEGFGCGRAGVEDGPAGAVGADQARVT
ncbi:transposase [Streptosporangium canum]